MNIDKYIHTHTNMHTYKRISCIYAHKHSYIHTHIQRCMHTTLHMHYVCYVLLIIQQYGLPNNISELEPQVSVALNVTLPKSPFLRNQKGINSIVKGGSSGERDYGTVVLNNTPLNQESNNVKRDSIRLRAGSFSYGGGGYLEGGNNLGGTNQIIPQRPPYTPSSGLGQGYEGGRSGRGRGRGRGQFEYCEGDIFGMDEDFSLEVNDVGMGYSDESDEGEEEEDGGDGEGEEEEDFMPFAWHPHDMVASSNSAYFGDMNINMNMNMGVNPNPNPNSNPVSNKENPLVEGGSSDTIDQTYPDFSSAPPLVSFPDVPWHNYSREVGGARILK